MAIYRGPLPALRQMSGTDPDGQNILSVLVKVTYILGANGRLSPAPQHLPLELGIVRAEDNKKLLVSDTDLYPHKVATDIVLKGHAYGYGPRPSFDVSLRVSNHRKTIRVFGDRECALGSDGRIRFSAPKSIAQVPLRYDFAYGGEDTAATAKHGNPYDELRRFLPAELAKLPLTYYDYPRNPAGRGFVIEGTREAIEQVQLPNLEDPLDLLTPERLVCGDAENWPTMPLPQAMDWVGLGWFPRLAYFGLVPPHRVPAQAIAEVARGFVPADILDEKGFAKKFDFRCTNGAALGLQVPHLNGGEEVELVNLHPQASRMVFRLPSDRPRIWTDGRKGKFNETKPVIHTVLIEPDQNRLWVLWRGSAPALRPYMPDELDRMPFRVEWG